MIFRNLKYNYLVFIKSVAKKFNFQYSYMYINPMHRFEIIRGTK